jgi:dipeptidyl aminopeptidase/acylaminoacyl peptidase
MNSASSNRSLGRACTIVIRGVLFAAGVLPLASMAQMHVMQPSDLANLKTVGDPRLSPDGRLVAYTVQTPAAAGKPRNEHIWIAETDRPGTARPFIYGSGADSSPAWSPDGHHLAFLSDRSNPLVEPGSPYPFSVVEAKPQAPAPDQKQKQTLPPATPDTTGADTDKTTQIWWISIDGGEAEPLTNLPGGVRSFKFSPDGKRIAFLRTDPATRAQQERKKAKNDENVIDHDYHFERLWTYDLSTHEARQLTVGDQNIDTLDWSPDGASIVSRVSPTPRLDDYWRVSKVILFDANTGGVKQIIEPVSGYEEPTFSHDGLRIAYSRFTTKRITDIHFVRTLATGQDLLLEDKLKGTLAEFHWMAGSHLFVDAYVGAHTEANEIDVSTATAVPLANLPATALDFDGTRDGSTLAFLGETPAQPLEVSVWRKGAVQVLTATNPQVGSLTLGTEREVQWQNPKDHHVIYGVLSLPPGYKPGTRYKTLIHLHGGPEEAFTVGFNANWYNYAALFASRGYVVLQPNYRGSAGQEIAFTEGDYQDAGGKDFDDMMAGVDWLEKEGIADPDRLVVAGWSYGGLMTSWAVTHTDRFKAAMSGAAVNDLYSMATTTDIAPSYLASYMGPLATPEDAARYDKHSAIRYVTACHTPVLVLHGEADVRVPLSQGQEFYHALRFLNREAEMVTYPREPHIFSEREHQIDSLTRELAWFDQHLPKDTVP